MKENTKETKYLSMSPNLFVKDLKVSEEFYTEVLGFKVLQQVPENADPVWMMLAHGDTVFMLQTTASMDDSIPSLKSEQRGGTLLFYVKLTNIKSYFKKVTKKAKLIKGLETTFYGALEFTIADPDGYLLTFAEFQE